jgi:ATP phosphoribosyltransferase
MIGLKIAVPNKGRMSEDIYDLLQKAGLTISKKENRSLCATTEDGNYTIIFVRTQDIPKFVNEGTVDIGFTGYDIVNETDVMVDQIMPLDFGYCKMVIAVKEESEWKTSQELPENIKIATSFPTITKKYFDKIGKKVHIIEVSGATEITPRLGLADVIVDITSSGSTLKVNKLRVIDEILKSQAVIIGRPDIIKTETSKIEAFKRAVNSAIDAEEKKYLMANLPKSSLTDIKQYLPGLSSPTITTLLDDDSNVAIHVVINKNKIYESVNKLKEVGATGILIMTVDQMIP